MSEYRLKRRNEEMVADSLKKVALVMVRVHFLVRLLPSVRELQRFSTLNL